MEFCLAFPTILFGVDAKHQPFGSALVFPGATWRGHWPRPFLPSVSISSDFTPLGSIRKLEVPGLFVRRQPVIDDGPIAVLIYIAGYNQAGTL